MKYSLTVYGKKEPILESMELEQEDLDWLRPYLGIFRHQWDGLYLANMEQDYGTHPQKKRIEFHKLNGVHHHTQHHAIRVTLANETAITCKETGITASIKTGSKYGTNLAWIHPLALSENTNRLIRECQALGIPLHKRFSPNELAGLLITILRSKNLTRIKDCVLANLYLQKASRHSLTMMIHFIHGLSSVQGLPQLNLLDIRVNHLAADWTIKGNEGKSHPEIHLLNWKRDVEAAQKTFTRSKRAPSSAILPSTRSVKVYKTDTTLAQAKTNKDSKARAKKLLEILKSRDSTGEFHTLFLTLGFNLETLQFLTKDKRQAIGAQIRSKFPQSNVEAWELAGIIAATSTDEIEKDLLGFVAEHAKETGSTIKPSKVNLLGLLKINQGKE